MAEGSTTSNTVIGPGPEVRGEANLLLVDLDAIMKNSKVGKLLESKPFMVGEATFTIGVFPNGETKTNEGTVRVFLGSKNDEDVVVRYCKITVAERSREFKADAIVKAKGGYGWNWFATQDHCRAALEGGNLRVKAEVELEGNMVVVDMDPGDSTTSCPDWILKNLFESRSEADCSLICEGQTVPAHSQVLAGASPYFDRLPKPRWGGQEKDGIEFDCTAEVGEAFVKFLYTDEIEEVVLVKNLTAFLKIGNFTMMEVLKVRVQSRMIRLLDRENMVEFFIAGCKYNGQKIREKAKQFVRANLKWLRAQAGWKEAFGPEKDLIIEILE